LDQITKKTNRKKKPGGGGRKPRERQEDGGGPRKKVVFAPRDTGRPLKGCQQKKGTWRGHRRPLLQKRGGNKSEQQETKTNPRTGPLDKTAGDGCILFRKTKSEGAINVPKGFQ